MPSTLVEDDVEGGQEVDEQESARKFTEKVCSVHPRALEKYYHLVPIY